MNTIPASSPTHQNEIISRGTHPAVDNLLFFNNADTAHIDNTIRQILIVEEDLASHSGNANPVPVIADASHHPGEQEFGVLHTFRELLRIVQISKKQGINQCNRLGTHAHHISQYAANTGGCSSVRLNGRWVIVALKRYDVRVIIIKIHDTCIFFYHHDVLWRVYS